LDWRAKVELFEQIRLEYEFGAGTIQGVARKLRVHRRLVREAIRSAIREHAKLWGDHATLHAPLFAGTLLHGVEDGAAGLL
jgi:hypothetical protein